MTDSGLFLTYAPLYLAKDEGFFAKEGLTVNVVNTPGGETAAAALFGGSAQFALDSTEHAIQATETGRPVEVFAGVNDQETVAVVVSNAIWTADKLATASPAARIAALKGKRLGVVSVAGENVLVFKELFNQIGLTPSAAGVQYLALGSPAAILSAMQSGRIDAFNLAAPFPVIAQNGGYGHISTDLALGQLPATDGMVSDSFQATASYLQSHADVAQRFTDAIAAAERWETRNPAAAAQDLHRTTFTQTPLSVLEGSLKETLAKGALAPNPLISAAGFQKNIDFLKLAGGKPPTAAPSSMYTNRFAQASLSVAAKLVP